MHTHTRMADTQEGVDACMSTRISIYTHTTMHAQLLHARTQ